VGRDREKEKNGKRAGHGKGLYGMFKEKKARNKGRNRKNMTEEAIRKG